MDWIRSRHFLWALTLACTVGGPVSVASQETPTGPNTSVRLNFEQRAAPVPTVLENLSRASGVRLTSVPAVASEIVVVRVEDATLQSVMDRIARVTSGEWVRDGNGFRLQADTSSRRSEETADIASRAEEIRRAIDELRRAEQNPTAAAGPLETVRVLQRGTGSSAAANAAVQFLSAVDPRLIAQMPDASRIVFSTNPTRMQRPLPGNVNQIVGDLIAAHNREVASRSADSTGPANPVMERLRSMGLFPVNRPIQAPPAKVVLAISNNGFGVGALVAELKLFDQEGAVILRGQQLLNLNRGILSTALGNNPAATRPTPPTFEGEDAPLRFSPETTEFAGVFGRAAAGTTTLSRGLEEKLLRPDLYDPLAFAPSEGLILSSKAKGWNLVGNLPDSMAGGLAQLEQTLAPGAASPTTVHQFLARTFVAPDVTAAVSDGWLTVEPKNPAESRRERVDRRALAALIGEARRTGTPSLDAIAAYAVHNRPPLQTPAATTHLILMAPNALSLGLQGGMLDWNMLRFWGSLTQSQRDTLYRGGTIAFGQLNPSQRANLERVLFGPNAGLRAERGEGVILRNLPGIVQNVMNLPARDFREEPTEIMPAGLPGMGSISASARVEPVAYPAGTSAGFLGRVGLGPSELAMMQWVREQGNLPIEGIVPNIENVRLGERRNINLTFTVAPGVIATRTLVDDRVDMNAAPVSVNNLPSAFQSAVEEEKRRLRQVGSRVDVLPMPGGRTNPSP